ncbi:TetM/TetW/TetO/TetS family tetracycline resistance ribosomal protection protein [Bifidobacterium amazonense]|uniref:TetM/TetW/TetO/TetS family tetracycline resistance ribosomal protection protein n=1 Tax=Bifidobacterium amazonense TaxID=2809027 RepID=A0ABS9VSR5_9BIFI|nr:TetM/TetW/TetO/TetS family tetracycline resistance ribosomal protection protein [Bifidobacterium amazonense]MCH9275122.1 TetM/TetW/TetO/TetS family tetracycline resistance ribosomal protection protein [Bifidobacterium amazonense]
MKRIVAGILAHVDAGKTTLSEALLYDTGTIRKLGRVDHGDAFLDTDAMERARGITIFAEPAVIETGDLELTLLDTPGHVDFAAETERTLNVLDYAILVVSGADGVQGHTATLWRLLARYRVPTFVFVNKMDAPGADRVALLAQLRRRFGDGCVDFQGDVAPEESEDVAMQDEAATDAFLANGRVSDDDVRRMIAERKLFPCFWGSALRMDGIAEFLSGFERYVREPRYGDAFGARIYKISHDAQGNRLTWLKVTGGELRAKMTLTNARDAAAEAGDPAGPTDAADDPWSEKADQVRVYSGAKFTTVERVPAGAVCAVTGLTHTFPGEGLGFEPDAGSPSLQPVLTYTLETRGNDVHKCLVALRELDDEDPLLRVVWVPRLQEIHVQLMGAVQLEIVEQIMYDRFGLDIGFGPGGILYRETITHPVEGVGHFEPLRHYAEAHILLEPAEPGSGLSFASAVSENVLARNWQRLILTHLREKEHLGVLTGSPITDMRLTLVAGRAHEKHTEGGDFRQATYRAVREGLMMARAEGDVSGYGRGAVDDGADDAAARDRKAGAADQSGTTTGDGANAANARDRKTGAKIGMADQPGSAGDGDVSAMPVDPGWCRLLEPWYRFRLEIPQDMIGRAMSDVQRMAGTFDPVTTDGDYAVLEGDCPVSEMRDYAMDVNAYTHGLGRLSCTFGGYRPCHDADEVIARADYDPESDLENTPDSVFCAHGAGYPVKWYKVPDFKHLDYATDWNDDRGGD